MRRNFRRQRILRDRTNPFDIYDDVELFARFRFWLEDIVTLVDLFGDELEHPLPRGGSLPPLMQVLVALRFFASGAFQQTTGDLFNIDRRTVGRIIARFSSVLSMRLGEFVHLPMCTHTHSLLPVCQEGHYRTPGERGSGLLEIVEIRGMLEVRGREERVEKK